MNRSRWVDYVDANMFVYMYDNQDRPNKIIPSL